MTSLDVEFVLPYWDRFKPQILLLQNRGESCLGAAPNSIILVHREGRRKFTGADPGMPDASRASTEGDEEPPSVFGNYFQIHPHRSGMLDIGDAKGGLLPPHHARVSSSCQNIGLAGKEVHPPRFEVVVSWISRCISFADTKGRNPQ